MHRVVALAGMLVACGGNAVEEACAVPGAADPVTSPVVVEGRLGLHDPMVDARPVAALVLADGSLIEVRLDRLPNPDGLLDALEGQRVRVEGSIAPRRPVAVQREPRPMAGRVDMVQVSYTVDAASLSVLSPR